MTQEISKKRDAKFVEVLSEEAGSIEGNNSSQPILDQIIENILNENEPDSSASEKVKKNLMVEFVDWNEVRIVRKELLVPLFSSLEDSLHKVKVLQAVLNKIFSRTGSLECQFLLDFEQNDLDDYLSGIMELREGSRKVLILRVFNKKILPFTTDHEIVFETFGTEFIVGDERMLELFSDFSTEALEGIKLLFDKILIEHITSGSSDFGSPTLDKIIKKVGDVS